MAYSIKDNKLQGQGVSYYTTNKQSGKIDPKFLVIHYSAGTSFSGDVDILYASGSQVSCHLVIGPNGEIAQINDFTSKLWHAGESEWKGLKYLNAYSIGIEVTCPGPVEMVVHGKDESTVKLWTGKLKTYPNDQLVIASHKHGGAERWWVRFTPAQIKALKEIGKLLCDTYKLEAIGHDDIAPKRKQDPGPCCPQGIFDFLNGKEVPQETYAGCPGKVLLDLIAKGEGTTGDKGYNVTVGYNKFARGFKGQEKPDITKMPISEIFELQKYMKANPENRFPIGKGKYAPSSAVGKAQIIEPTLRLAIAALKMDPNTTIFNRDTQDKIKEYLMLTKAKFQEFIDGKVDAETALQRLALEWDSLPEPKTGCSRYSKSTRVSVAESYAAMEAAKKAYLGHKAPDPIKTNLYEATVDDLNLRAFPSTRSRIIAVMAKGAKVEKIREKSKWWCVKVEDLEGWVDSAYLRKVG